MLVTYKKTKKPMSNYCTTDLYFYPGGGAEKAKLVKTSSRGELKITELNEIYLKVKSLKGLILGGGHA